ncbi:MAG: hypothetical protein ABSC31_08265 [Acidimicrobiales bacterium]|jgi:hypothetical protein
MTAPTKAQITLVRQVLYNRSSVGQVRDALSSIDVLLGLAPSTPSGSGPTWIIPDTGQIGPSVIEASRAALRIASILEQEASAIGGLSIPAADRSHLVRALNLQASAWTARAKAWVRTGPLSAAQITSTLKIIGGYESAAAAAATKVSAYLIATGTH